MKITPELTQKIADLAQIQLTEDESIYYASELAKIITSFEELSKVNTEGIDPLINPLFDHKEFFAHYQGTRPDEVQESLSTQQVLKNAPSVESGQFKINSFVEE